MTRKKSYAEKYAEKHFVTGQTAGRMNDDAKPAQPKQEEPTRFAIVLSYPPTANTLYVNKHGGRLLSKKGREYCDLVTVTVWKEYRQLQRMTGRLRVNMAVRCPDHRRRDLDNVQKIVWDALGKAGVYVDDSQIDELHVYRGTITPPGYIAIVIRQIDENLEKSRKAEKASQAEAAEAAED